MICGNLDILKLIDYYENGTDLSNYSFSNYNFYDLWNAAENAASPPTRIVCSTLSIPDILSVTKAILGEFTTASEYLGTNLDFYYLYLKAIGSPDATPTFSNSCVYELYQVFTVNSLILDTITGASFAIGNILLKSDYTGFLVEILRTSDTVTDSFYPDANGKLSGDSLNAGGDTLTVWLGGSSFTYSKYYDQSGNSKNATQSTESFQPIGANSGVIVESNGISASDYDQATSILSTSNVNFGTNTTLISVFTPDIAASGFDVIFKIGSDSSGNRRSFALNSGNVFASAFANNLNLGSFAIGQQYIARQYAEGNNQYGAINSNSIVSGTYTLNDPPSAPITVGSSGIGEFYGGTIQCCIAYDSSKRTDDSTILTLLNNTFNTI